MNKGKNSSVIVARVLGSEGYTSYVAARVRSYWNARVKNQNPKVIKRLENVERAFRDHVGKTLSQSQRQVLGKFISLREKQAFDVGLRVGLTTRLFDPDKEE